ncbi:rh5-interacting protein-like [Microplitis mediator]|uniref:rh5-interacting protein-like n=1 Tax=Microplitis mediator TaxID=375433 RepID=UPI00255768BC|nr:rh5-interacting protein-like [Microplitis mediator]
MCSENNKCVCRHKFVPMNKFTCTPTVGASCTENVECQPARLLCLDNKCQYYTNFSTVLNSKPVQVALGSPCQINADCTILNSKCGIHKKCVCGANTLALNESTCVSILHGSCSNDDQCYPFPVRCSYNKCQCNQDFTSVSANQCIKTNLLYSCSSDLECSDLWHSRCSNDGKCVCRSNNIATNNSTCLPILGGNCWKDDQCTTENSACIDFRCTCKPKFIAVARNQCVSID